MSAVFAAILVGIGFAAWATARAAQEAVLDSQSGSISAVALDPSAPGFRAFAEPTPTGLVLHTAIRSGGRPELSGVTLLAGADSDRGGTLVSIPADFTVEEGSGQTLAELFENGGFSTVQAELEGQLRIGFGDVVVLDSRSWTQLMASDIPLTLSLRDDLIELVSESESRTLLAAGTRPFDLAEIELIATHLNPDDTPQVVARRQQDIWRAWIGRTAAADERPDIFSVDVGFVSLIDGLASGEVSYRTVPETTEAFEVLISQIIPFPTAAEPGDRPSVMLLDGTGGAFDRDAVLAVVVRAGGQVAILGNDVSDVRPATEVQVHDNRALETARLLAAELGAPDPILVPLSESTVDVTVVIGADQLDGP